jgi:hypothetical protein
MLAGIIPANKKPGGGLLPRRVLVFGAGNETRTRDPDLGKVVLYQLSYSRFEGAYFKHIGGCVNVILH